MKIAIDLNDVVRDNMYQFLKTYQKYIDPAFELNLNSITSTNQMEDYPFVSEGELTQFKYIDYAFELYGLADVCDHMLNYTFNDWCEKTLKNLDEENVPEVMLFSPFEMGLSIQSTYSFLSSKTIRVREMYFPKDSMTIYDRADIVITAQPSLIENCPEGKFVIKVNKPYNKDIETKYSFNSLIDIINDPNETIIKILENRING